MSKINTIIFDLGGVLIDWNPEYLYKKIFSNEQDMRFFLDNICTKEWNEEQDAGYPLEKATKDFLKPLEFAFETLLEITDSSCIAEDMPDLIIENINHS